MEQLEVVGQEELEGEGHLVVAAVVLLVVAAVGVVLPPLRMSGHSLLLHPAVVEAPGLRGREQGGPRSLVPVWEAVGLVVAARKRGRGLLDHCSLIVILTGGVERR